MSLINKIDERGLVIISRCSHFVIVNLMKQARRVTGIDKIIGVIDGLHFQVVNEEN